MQLEPREISVFITLAEELHFGRAAGRLHLTPSRVSQVLRALETRLGGRLLDRTSRSVSLTPLGQQLLDRVRPAYEELELALADARHAAAGIAGTLRLGMYLPVNGGPHLPEIIGTFESRHPACRVQVLDVGMARSELDWLRQGEADLLATRLPISVPGITVGPVLSCENRVVAVSRDHPLAGQESVCLDDLSGYRACDFPGIRRELMDAFTPPHTPDGRHLRRIAVRSISEALMRTALSQAIHLTVQSTLDYISHPSVVAVPVRDLPPSQTALAWLATSSTPPVAAFARAARDVLTAKAPELAAEPWPTPRSATSGGTAATG